MNSSGDAAGRRQAKPGGGVPPPRHLQTSLLVRKVIGCAIDVHKTLGPGLLESAYEACLAYEFTAQGLVFARQLEVPVVYKGVHLDCGYRTDIVFGTDLLLELKTVDRLLPIHEAQVLTYLRLLGVKQGLLINFNVPRLVEGLKSLLT